MCIRDRLGAELPDHEEPTQRVAALVLARLERPDRRGGTGACLLYTSDAADERSSVDLGGRRIIKKKNQPRNRTLTVSDYNSKKTT